MTKAGYFVNKHRAYSSFWLWPVSQHQ